MAKKSFGRIGAGLALLASLACFTPFAVQGWRDVRAFRFYEEGRCTVLARGFYDTWSGGSSTRSGTTTPKVRHRHPELFYRVDAGGRIYNTYGFDNMNGRLSDLQEADPFRTGETYRCWYDPSNPERAILKRQLRPKFYALAGIPAFMTFVSWAIFASQKKRSGRKAKAIDGITKGQYLAKRLAPDFTANSRIRVGVIVIAIYLAIVAPLTWLILTKNEGFFFLLFFGAGLLGLLKRLVAFVRARNAGDPIVEIEDEPVRRGSRVKVFVRHPAAELSRFRVVARSMDVLTRRQRDIVLLEKPELRSELLQTKELDVSSNAPLSDDGKHAWAIVVERNVNGTDVDVEFAFRVV